jgi:hypothetical protein
MQWHGTDALELRYKNSAGGCWNGTAS